MCDRIYDFRSGIDRSDLSAIDANARLAGNQAFQLRAGAAGHGAGDAWVVSLRGRGKLQADLDGNGTVDFSIQFTGGIPLTAADIAL